MSDRAALLLLLVVPGCTQVFGLEPPRRGVDSGVVDTDAPDDSMSVACYGAGLVKVCPRDVPALVELTGDLDTTTDPRCSSDSNVFCVIVATQVQVNAATSVGVSGSRPLVVLGTDTVEISTTFGVGSYLGPMGLKVGAGEGTPEQCGTAPVGASSAIADAGGGAGGSFGGRGGDGGASGGGTAGGISLPPRPAPTVLRGGCPGGDGGDVVSTNGGAGGHGGGALYVIAGSSITITSMGILFAGGAGGAGGAQGGGGGGGGGSGGFIGLDAPSITCQGFLSADGGGGGEGGATLSGNGAPGSSSAANPTVRAPGGTGNQYGGDGGRGSLGTFVDGDDGLVGGDGGGGGGGAAGVIKIYGGGSAAGCMASPAPT